MTDEQRAPISEWADAATDLLRTAQTVVERRQSQYGTPSEHHTATAAMWTAYLGTTILPDQVSVLFILDKIVRSTTEDKPDHWLDVAGYSQVHAMVMLDA